MTGKDALTVLQRQGAVGEELMSDGHSSYYPINSEQPADVMLEYGNLVSGSACTLQEKGTEVHADNGDKLGVGKVISAVGPSVVATAATVLSCGLRNMKPIMVLASAGFLRAWADTAANVLGTRSKADYRVFYVPVESGFGLDAYGFVYRLNDQPLPIGRREETVTDRVQNTFSSNACAQYAGAVVRMRLSTLASYEGLCKCLGTLRAWIDSAKADLGVLKGEALALASQLMAVEDWVSQGNAYCDVLGFDPRTFGSETLKAMLLANNLAARAYVYGGLLGLPEQKAGVWHEVMRDSCAVARQLAEASHIYLPNLSRSVSDNGRFVLDGGDEFGLVQAAEFHRSALDKSVRSAKNAAQRVHNKHLHRLELKTITGGFHVPYVHGEPMFGCHLDYAIKVKSVDEVHGALKEFL